MVPDDTHTESSHPPLRDVREFLAERGLDQVLLVRHDLKNIDRMIKEERPEGIDFILRAKADGVEWVAILEATERSNAVLQRIYRSTGEPAVALPKANDFDWRRAMVRAEEAAPDLEGHLVVPKWPTPRAYCLKDPAVSVGAFLSEAPIAPIREAGFVEQPANQEERAARAWPILTARAKERQTIHYSELGMALGIHTRPVRYVLSVIQDYCLNMRWPPLTVLVVDKSGKVGSGFIAGDPSAPQDAQEEVFEFPWESHGNPFEFARGGASTESIAAELIADPSGSEGVYRRVRDRGTAQGVFRAALLRAYRSRCAFCGLAIETALEGAHIIPWGDASPADRVHPRNGLLLCATHHKLFDAGLLLVTDEFLVEAGPRLGHSRHAVGASHDQVAGVIGAKVSVPRSEAVRPALRCLEHHRHVHRK